MSGAAGVPANVLPVWAVSPSEVSRGPDSLSCHRQQTLILGNVAGLERFDVTTSGPKALS